MNKLATVAALAPPIMVLRLVSGALLGLLAVSYTHLDVYKRQGLRRHYELISPCALVLALSVEQPRPE